MERQGLSRGLLVAILVVVLLIGGLALWYLLRGPVQVPAVTTQSLDSAAQELGMVSLQVGTTGKVATTAVGPQTVVSQSPVAQTWVQRRTSVDMTVAVTPETLPAPGVIGQSADSALKSLASMSYLPMPISIYDSSTNTGQVTQQVPREGTPWLTGRPIAYTVITGPDPGTGVAIPDLTGASPADAASELTKLGLSASAWVGNPANPAANSVSAEFPSIGTRVPQGSTVLLLFAAN